MPMPEPVDDTGQPATALGRWLASPPSEGWLILWVAAAALLTVIAAVVTWQTVRAIEPGQESRRWPTTTGTVLESKTDWADPYVRYTYLVDGVPHESHRVLFGPTFDDEEIASKYHLGDRVLVYYDADSGRAVLEPGPPAASVMAFMWGWAALAWLPAALQLVRLSRSAGAPRERWREYTPDLQIGG
jgi:hypothetical protein